MGYFVYVHTNKINGKRYVGATTQKPQRRWGSTGNNYKRHPYFYSAIQKYGWDNFEHYIFEVCSENEMHFLERYLISYYGSNNRDRGYNLSKGGESGNYQGIGPEGYKEHSKAYVDKHKDKKKEYQRQWYLKHKESVKERTRKWAEEHKEEQKDYIRLYQKKWRAENPDKLKAQQKRHRQKRKNK